jgi:peptide chain release factor 2
MLQPSFWDNRETADKLVGELKYIKNIITNVNVLSNSVNSALEMIDDSDDDVRLLLEEEINELKAKIDKLEIETYLNGKYDKNAAIMEIHAGAGGTESCDWVQMLYRMYSRYAEKNGYSITLLDRQDGEEAGIKSIMFQVDGTFAYGYLKGEKGVHRLVRISPFDANKRRHTSFAAVDVIPEIDNDIEVNINDSDIRVDIYRSSGPGGQGVNTTDSAVRLTHIPTGIIVYSQTERSQIKNKELAFKILKTRLYDMKLREQEEKEAAERKVKIGTGDRSEKIRTYNYPQNRITDHRIGYTSMNLDRVMDGDMEDLIEALINEDQKKKLEGTI